MNASSLATGLLQMFIRPRHEYVAASLTTGTSPAPAPKPPVRASLAMGYPTRTAPLVIIVDHDEVTRQHIGQELREAGVKVLHLKNSVEFLDATPIFQPDLVLMSLPLVLAENVEASVLRQCAEISGNPPIIFLGAGRDEESLDKVRNHLQRKWRNLEIAEELAEIAASPAPLDTRITTGTSNDGGSVEAAPTTVKPEVSRQDLAPVVSLAGWVFQPVAANKQITLKIDAPATGLLAVCDEVRIQRVIENLLANAIRHTPKGGTVTLGARVENDVLRVWVDDEGPGVPLSEQGGLFEDQEYYLNVQDANESGGNRGLVTCQHIAALHQGKMEMYNRCEGGAHFELSLPAARAPRISAEDSQADDATDKVTPFTSSAKPSLVTMNIASPSVA